MKVISQQLIAREPVNINGVQYQHFSGRDFAAGETLTTHLSGLSESDDYQALKWSAILLTILIGGFVLFYLVKRRPEQPVSVQDDLDKKKHRLIAELAQLDDDFEAGNIAEDVYNTQRAAKKAQLKELIIDIKIR